MVSITLDLPVSLLLLPLTISIRYAHQFHFLTHQGEHRAYNLKEEQDCVLQIYDMYSVHCFFSLQ
jgi:hypothetical protein